MPVRPAALHATPSMIEQVLLAALFLGAALRLSTGREVTVPAEVSRWTQAFIGVMLGGYLNLEAMRSVGPVLAPFVLISVLTIALSVAAAWLGRCRERNAAGWYAVGPDLAGL